MAHVSIVMLVCSSLSLLAPSQLEKKRLAKLIPIDAKLEQLLKAARREYDSLGNLPGMS
jgi:hypothetical protein